MASLIEELTQIIEETTGCYGELLIVANNKKDVIIQGDVPGLQTLTDQEQGLAGRLLRLEKKREEILKDICTVTNKKYNEMTVSYLVNLLEKQPKEQQALKIAGERLVESVKQVKEVNDLNKLLIEQSLDFIDYSVNVIKSSMEAPQGNAYERKGNRYESNGNNFFDAKQ